MRFLPRMEMKKCVEYCRGKCSTVQMVVLLLLVQEVYANIFWCGYIKCDSTYEWCADYSHTSGSCARCTKICKPHITPKCTKECPDYIQQKLTTSTTASTPTSAQPKVLDLHAETEKPEEGNKFSWLIIMILVMALIIFIIIIISVLFGFLWWRRKRSRNQATPDDPNQETQQVSVFSHQ